MTNEAIRIRYQDGSEYTAATWDDLVTTVKYGGFVWQVGQTRQEYKEGVQWRVIGTEGRYIEFDSAEIFFRELERAGLLTIVSGFTVITRGEEEQL